MMSLLHELFRSALEDLKPRIVVPGPAPLSSAPAYPAPPFERTKCDCERCSSHCYEQPGSCGPGDVEAIATYMQQSPSEVLHLFRASPGAIIVEKATGKETRIPTITPATVPGTNGRCVFLSSSGRCSIHAVAPFGCRMFDHHMSAKESDRRARWHTFSCRDTFTYQILASTLQPASSYRPRERYPVRQLVMLP